MSSTKNEILALLRELFQDLPDSDTIDVFYDEVIAAVGRLPDPFFVRIVQQTLTSGTAIYDYKTDMLRILHAIMADTMLYETTEDDLNAYSQSWSDDTGNPVAYTIDKVTHRTYRLYPEPDFNSGAFIPTEAQPYGVDYPDDILCLIYADNRTSAIEDFFVLYIIFAVAEKEFEYPSDHTDAELAKLCGQIAQLFYALAGM